MECEICFESYNSEERTPLVLACKCHKVMCHCCVTRRLDSTARCPYCDIRWSVRNYISQCKQMTPANMLSQLLDIQKTKISETPHAEKYSNLGSGELRRYYEKAVQDIIKKATENAAEQIEEDQEFAEVLFEKLQREAEEETVVIKQREEEDALLAAKIANESRNRFVFKKDGGYLKEHKNGIDRFVKKDKISIPDRSASSSSSSSSPPRQAPVPNTSSSSSSSPCKAKNRTINGQESCTLGNTIQPESKPFNSSVRLSSMAGTAVNSLNKRNKPPATSQASSHAPKNGIPSFFVKGPISAVRGSLRAHSATGRDPVCGEHRIFLDRDFHDLVSDDDDDDSCPATDTAESRYADNVQGRCGGRGGDKKSERRRHEIIEIDVDTGQKRGRERERETDQQDGVGVGVGEGSWKIPSIESRTGAHAMNRQVRRGLGSHSENQIDHGQASHLVNRAPVTERRCPQNAQALPPPATWSCTACTYKNLSPLTTCEICDTTKSH